MTAEAQATTRDNRQLRKYNYEHFWLKHLLADLWRTVRGEGVQPGSEAPDFELESTEGNRVRLSELRGSPVLLHLGSAT
ncbi:MAG: redoxin domain-containing protein [Rubrobacter sp.]|jgi:cytochrome oxidase Cu insertion factor (SCO1/SenC/PrrC family)|nr:redoxin domain-containing protein [Rubrobacter sp.]